MLPIFALLLVRTNFRNRPNKNPVQVVTRAMASETRLSIVDVSAKETLPAAAAPTRLQKKLRAEKRRRQK